MVTNLLYCRNKKKVFQFTFCPLISHVIFGAGRAFDVVQFANNFSPIANCRLLNDILGGPICCTVIYIWRKNRREKMFTLLIMLIMIIKINGGCSCLLFSTKFTVMFHEKWKLNCY